MKITIKIQKFNTGTLFCNIPKNVVDFYNLRKGSVVELDIKKVDNKNVIKRWRCKKCEHQFDMEDDNVYCPACDCEDVEEIYVKNG